MNQEQLAAKLTELIAETEHSIQQYEIAAAPVAPDDAIGRVSRMDAINNKAVVEAALRTARRKLQRLKTMEANLGDPNLGLCKRCGRAIPLGRVLAMPESPFCVRCSG